MDAELPDRLEPVDVLPLQLARLLAAARSEAPNYRAQLRDLLLELTVRQAYDQCDYYQAVFPDTILKSFNASELESLPILTREHLVAAGESIRSRFADFAFCSYTSGSTGEPLIIYRSLQEQLYLSDLFTLLHKKSGRRPQLALSVASWHHGQKLELPPGDLIQFPVYLGNVSGYSTALTLLSKSYRVRASDDFITIIAGSTNRIQQLARYLKTRPHDENCRMRIQTIATSGRPLTNDIRAELKECWPKSLIQDSYSLTEMFGTANYCHQCGGYHFSDFVVPEVLALDSHESISQGRGRLVLTALYPFTQMTPLIRYEPGDLVERSSNTCHSGLDRYLFLGRSSRYIRLPGGTFVSSVDINDALTLLPGVSREADPSPVPDECKHSGTPPLFTIEFVKHPILVVAVDCLNSLGSIELHGMRETILKALASKAPLTFDEALFEIQFVEREHFVDRAFGRL